MRTIETQRAPQESCTRLASPRSTLTGAISATGEVRRAVGKCGDSAAHVPDPIDSPCEIIGYHERAVRSLQDVGRLYEYGRANRFIAARKAGTIKVKDSTCPTIHAALIAGEKGLPFMPVRGLIGSDILHHRMQGDGWLSIDNPFGENDPIVLVPPLRPDVTLLHAPLADRFGNVWIGRRTEFATMARASAKTLVTFEECFAGDLMADRDKAPATIPAFHVTALSHQPNGAWPLHGGDAYPEDAAHLREYAERSKTAGGFAEYLQAYVLDVDVAA